MFFFFVLFVSLSVLFSGWKFFNNDFLKFVFYIFSWLGVNFSIVMLGVYFFVLMCVLFFFLKNLYFNDVFFF